MSVKNITEKKKCNWSTASLLVTYVYHTRGQATAQ